MKELATFSTQEVSGVTSINSVRMHLRTPIYRLVRQTKIHFIFEAFYKDRVDTEVETWYILVSSRIQGLEAHFFTPVLSREISLVETLTLKFNASTLHSIVSTTVRSQILT